MKLLRLVLSVNWKMRTRFTFLLYVMLYAYRKESMKELKDIISDIDDTLDDSNYYVASSEMKM